MKFSFLPALPAIMFAAALIPGPVSAHTGHVEHGEQALVFNEAYRAQLLDEWETKRRALARAAPAKTALPTVQRPVQVASSVSAHTLVSLLQSSAFTPPAGNGALMAASFAPFKPKVRFYWDNSYFYEESDGTPDRTRMPNLMVGITSWQQQIPLPTSYFAGTTNATNDAGSLGYQQPNCWKIPLVPVPAASPIPISSGNFQRGGIALAADGVPIFNPANNTGHISYEIGELDTYGGHCGLGDDYHYHIAPVHLIPVLGNDKPIAWLLDGYPMYGYVEPDGSAMQALDVDGGHDHGSWGYHYHARGTFNPGTGQWTPSAPYMNAAFHGTVVNYGGQVDPQPTASGLRASGTGGYTASPVAGALITAFKNPVALSTDGSGHFIENIGGTASDDDWLMRFTVGGTSYDICWRLNRKVNPRSLTITWRLPGATTTTTYNNGGNRITAYPMAPSSMAALPDTSQVLDATATYGEDADYTIHAQSFTDNGNGTITDHVTGLMWQKTDNGESTWENAVTNASSVNTGGYTDWRLPTPAELFSIFNHNNGNPEALNTTYFPSNSPAAEYWWTRDVYGNSTTNVWCANAGGGLGGKPKAETISAGGAFRYHARYVRGARANNGHNYLNNGDGTITDLDTGLMWQQVPGPAVAWDAALSYAENLTLAGYTDWRLPNIKELQTLTDYTLATSTSPTGIKPCINRTLFPTAAATACWSSTTLKGASTTEAWLLELGINSSTTPPRNSQGIISYEAKTSAYPVFAVRNAPVSTQIAVEQPAGTSLTDAVSTVSYGNVNVGSVALKTFVIRNTGSTSLTILGTSIDGMNAANYSVVTPPAGSIAPGGSTTMDVQFHAASAGTKLAALHIASSDSAVGSAFDITLSGTGYLPPPSITAVGTNPAVPGNLDTPYGFATVTPANGATITGVQLTYSTGAQTTNTVFAETMANTATGGTGGWDGTGAIYPWTVTSTAGAGNIKQTTAANHGAGNVCGLEMGKGSASATATMVHTSNPINASGTLGHVEFWAATANLTAGLGWNLQLSTDGTNWNTRLSESAGVNHAHQLQHYDLTAAERVSTLRMRFQFIGNGTGGPTGPKSQFDDITVVSTAGAAPVTVTMFDDGLHGDGAAGDGVYGVQLPAQVSGTTVSYSISATDSNSSTTTLSAAGSYTTGPAPTITTPSPLPNASTIGAYSQSLAATGGTPGYSWSVSAGALPGGLTLSVAGVISGTPDAPGTFNFTVRVTDSAGRIGTKAFSLTVAATTAPNVVIILTDDQGWGDIGCHTPAGQVPIQTPNMDGFLASGIRLEKFYATSVCSVTRSCLLTGRNTIRTAVGNTRGLDPHEHIMPQTFKAAGYQTYMCGKWHLGGSNYNVNFTSINGTPVRVIQEGLEYAPHNRGWDIHYGQYGGAINYFTHHSVDPDIANTLDWWLNGVPMVESSDLQGHGGYSTDLLADKAVSLIQNRDKARPMLLYLAFNAVHAGVSAPPSYLNKYAALGVTNASRRAVAAAVDCMDVAMGRVLNALDSEGISNNTIVVYMSDNGGNEPSGSFNDPLRGTKNDEYDGGIHTPAAIRWPGVLPGGVTSNQYVWVGDIFPTLCAATAVTPQNAKPFDGLNLWPALLTASNATAQQRPSTLVTATGTVTAFDVFTEPVSGGSKMFKLIRTRTGTNVITNQLFNMTDDPYETTDVLLGASAASYSTITAQLTTAITNITPENYPPYIGEAPKTQSVQQGDSITLYAPFTSYRVPSVQWRKNGVNISGATSYFQVTDNLGVAVNGVYMTTLTFTNVNSTHTANYSVVISNVGGTTTSGAGALTIIHPVSTQDDGIPDNWKLAHGLDPNSTAAADGPLGDIDHDSRRNLLEYAFNTDPQVGEPDPIQAAVVTKTTDGLNYLEVRYPRRIGALDLMYAVEISDDLTTWPAPGAASELVSVVPNGDGVTEAVTVRVLPATTGTAMKFVRIKVTAE